MSEYPWNEKNNTFTWLSSLYNPLTKLLKRLTLEKHKTYIDYGEILKNW